jgi:hypothetical protein
MLQFKVRNSVFIIRSGLGDAVGTHFVTTLFIGEPTATLMTNYVSRDVVSRMSLLIRRDGSIVRGVCGSVLG